MAFIARLIIAFLAVLPSVSLADSYYWPFGSNWYPDAATACKQNYPGATNFAYPVFYNDGANAQCFWYGTTGGVQNTYGEQSGADVARGTCPGSKIPDFENRVCIDPPPAPECSVNQELDEETNTCVCKTGPAGSFAVSGDVLYGCNDGCAIVLNSGSYSSSANKTYGYWRQNGNTCSPSPDSPDVDSPDSPDGQDAGKCPPGQCPGTFNGQFMCVPCKGKESSDSSGSENTTETPEGASAPSGSASQSQSGSKSTECEGGVCTTKETVVIRNPDGSTTEKQKETTESISDYCAKNPKAAICKAEEAGQWGGACAGGFQCKGDAVQCAQAQAAWKAACLLDVAADDPNVVKGGQAMSSDQSALRAQLGLDDTGDNFNLSSMIDSDPLFAAGGGCPADQQVTLLGQSLTLSLSSWCSWLQIAGTILQAAAYLAAALIVFRRG